MFASLNNLLVPSLPFSFPYHLNQFIPFTFSKSKVRDDPCAISLAGPKWQLHLFDYTVIGASEIGREKEREMESSCLPVAYLVFFGRSHPFLWNEVRPNSGCHFCLFALIHFLSGREERHLRRPCVAGGLPCSTQCFRGLCRMPVTNLHSQQGCLPARHPLFLHLCLWLPDKIGFAAHFALTHTSSAQKMVERILQWIKVMKTDEWMSWKSSE